MARRTALALGVTLFAVGTAASPTLAQELENELIRVDLELVLAVDVSRSMDYDEQEIQREGYAAAFRDEDLIDALTGGYNGRVAVTYLQWANEYTQHQALPWTVISSADEALAFADAIDNSPLVAYRGTSISGALMAAADLINGNEYEGMRQVIDISGDGSNRDGPPLRPVRDAVVQSGITINGLPLMLRPSQGGFGGGGFGGGGGGGFGFEEVVDLEAYYEEEVIGGQGAFVLPVRDVAELPGSIRQKLILEIAGDPALLRRAELDGYEVTAAE